MDFRIYHLMEDFRNSPQYKIFNSCRVNNEKYDAALAAFEQSDVKDLSAAKRASIEAMAYNESCLLSAKKVPILTSSQSIKEQGIAATNAYFIRVKAENHTLSNIITSQTTSLGDEAIGSMKSLAVENARFSRLESYVESEYGFGAPAWVYVMLVAALLLAFRGYRKLPKAKGEGVKDSPGVIRQSFGFLKGIYDGLKNEYSTIQKGIKSKKDKDNV